MNRNNIDLCYFADVGQSTLEAVRKASGSFGCRTESLVDNLAHRGLSRTTVSIGRGHDLVVVVTDGATPHVDFGLTGYYNHVIEDPWATLVISCSSLQWTGYQPVIHVESERYIGHYSIEGLPTDLWELLCIHRPMLHDRGISATGWKSIERSVTPGEWQRILSLRGL